MAQRFKLAPQRRDWYSGDGWCGARVRSDSTDRARHARLARRDRHASRRSPRGGRSASSEVDELQGPYRPRAAQPAALRARPRKCSRRTPSWRARAAPSGRSRLRGCRGSTACAARRTRSTRPAIVMGRDACVRGSFAEHRRAAIRALRTLDRQHLVHACVRGCTTSSRSAGPPPSAPSVSSPPSTSCGGSARRSAAAARHCRRARRRAGQPPAPVRSAALGRGQAASWPGRPGRWRMVNGRIVLFHDSPPQGPGNAEVLEPGLGAVRRTSCRCRTHAKRLRLDDPCGVALFARRFAPAPALPRLEPGDARMDWDGAGWRSPVRGCSGGSIRRREPWWSGSIVMLRDRTLLSSGGPPDAASASTRSSSGTSSRSSRATR